MKRWSRALTPSVRDLMFMGRAVGGGAVRPTLVALSHSTVNGNLTAAACGANTAFGGTTFDVVGTPAVGDLLVVMAGASNSSSNGTTLALTDSGGTVGTRDSGITCDAANGGFSCSEGTPSHLLKFYSHVIQPGDITGNQVFVKLSLTPAGTGNIIVCYIFRHPNGWPTTGTKHGCPTQNTANGANATSSETLTITGPATPYVAVAAWGAGSPTAQTFNWDANFDALGTANDVPASSPAGNYATSARPGRVHSQGYLGGDGTVLIGGGGSGHAVGLVTWKAN